MFTINVKSVFFLMQALVPVLANPSSVVLNSSASAHTAAATANAYAATKGAVSTLMRSWNADLLGSHGVRVHDQPRHDRHPALRQHPRPDDSLRS
jgi:NAD(P)-dependent dehydrogenase (short-subunit alcohol dehydrogenase family)